MGEYKVRINRKVEKRLWKLPQNIQEKLVLLLQELKGSGPIQKKWANFSALGPNRFHCHLAYGYVACWSHEKGTTEIEVYYAGSREGAPY